MRGALRFSIALLGTGLLLGPDAAFAQQAAQDASAPPSNAPADAVGPRELQNFSLQGTVTRPAEQPPAQRAVPSAAAESQQTPLTTHTPPPRLETRARAPVAARAKAPPPGSQTAAAIPQQLQELTPAPTTVDPVAAPAAAASASAPAFPPAPESITPALAPERSFSFLPWLLAAVALGAGAALLFWRSRSRRALAGGPELDLFVAPEPGVAPPTPHPAPTPAPTPAPRAAEPTPPSAGSMGIVSSSLRPWIDITVQPLRCIVTDESVAIDFELELFNTGGARARSVAIEGLMINAGAMQDQELASFFANPPVPGNRIEVVEPLHRVNFPTQLLLPRQHVVAVEMAGHPVFVPLLAFNAIYRAGSAEARTSISFLIGRNGNGDKLAPFRLDLGPRVFRDLGSRQLPTGIRR